MMKHMASSMISGLLAIIIYCILIALLVFYFNTRSEEKSKHFVKKDEHRIQVSLASPQKVTMPKKSLPKVAQTLKKKPKKRVKVKKRLKPKSRKSVVKKSVPKKHRVKKKNKRKREHNRTKATQKASNLFKNIKTVKREKLTLKVTDKPMKRVQKKSIIKVSSMSASERINASLKSQKVYHSGVENAYFAKVQAMLEEWPAQSGYAGEKAKVILYIKPSGLFRFKIVSHSAMATFNRDLELFLEQLQVHGFGRHQGGRTYIFEAEFIAKE